VECDPPHTVLSIGSDEREILQVALVKARLQTARVNTRPTVSGWRRGHSLEEGHVASEGARERSEGDTYTTMLRIVLKRVWSLTSGHWLSYSVCVCASRTRERPFSPFFFPSLYSTLPLQRFSTASVLRSLLHSVSFKPALISLSLKKNRKRLT
jgi:hypothetical protein